MRHVTADERRKCPHATHTQTHMDAFAHVCDVRMQDGSGNTNNIMMVVADGIVEWKHPAQRTVLLAGAQPHSHRERERESDKDALCICVCTFRVIHRAAVEATDAARL